MLQFVRWRVDGWYEGDNRLEAAAAAAEARVLLTFWPLVPQNRICGTHQKKVASKLLTMTKAFTISEQAIAALSSCYCLVLKKNLKTRIRLLIER